MEELGVFLVGIFVFSGLVVYSLMAWVYYFGAIVAALVNNVNLIRDPVWVVGTCLIWLFAPVVLPFMKGLNDEGVV